MEARSQSSGSGLPAEIKVDDEDVVRVVLVSFFGSSVAAWRLGE